MEPTRQSLGQYLQHWLGADIERRLAARTAARHRGIVEKNIIPRLGTLPIRSLTAAHIEALEDDLQREGWVKAQAKRSGEDNDAPPPKRGLSARTVLHVHRTLSQALNHAVRLGLLYRNPAQQVRPPRPPHREIKILTKEEIGIVLEAARATELHLPVLVSLTTGIRRGELLALRWSDVDLDAGTLSINQAQERIKGKVMYKSPKTRTSRRTITLPAACVAALREHKARQAEHRLALGLGRDPEALVFIRPDGGPMDADTLSKAFSRLIKGARVTRITLHGLRHTHISHLLMDGVHVKVVSERAGHANVNVTLGVYAAYIPNMQADAALRVDAWLR
ncbi:MAG TPA: site-specific integrase [Polyangiaceae bacterium]|nr:site-specific integrase [Polyangiaceae bacterium]